MNAAIFEAFWQKTLLPLGRRVTLFTEMLLFDESKKGEIHQRYEFLTFEIQKLLKFQVDTARMDRYHVSATLMVACLEAVPFLKVVKYQKVEKLHELVELVNEAFAVSAALLLMQAYLEQKIKKEYQPDLERIVKEGFAFPQYLHDSYIQHLFNLIRVTKPRTPSDVLYLANILFLIEQFTVCHKKSQSEV